HHGHVAADAIGCLGHRAAASDLGDHSIPVVEPDRPASLPDLRPQHALLPSRQRPQPHRVGHAVPPWEQRMRATPFFWPNPVGSALAAPPSVAPLRLRCPDLSVHHGPIWVFTMTEMRTGRTFPGFWWRLRKAWKRFWIS